MTDAIMPAASERGADGRARLAFMLREARERAGLSGAEAGRRSGLAQSKISRIETGALLPTHGEIETLAEAYGASADVRVQLVDLTRPCGRSSPTASCSPEA